MYMFIAIAAAMTLASKSCPRTDEPIASSFQVDRVLFIDWSTKAPS